jgi:multiple sugar transport system substrate-binding protein
MLRLRNLTGLLAVGVMLLVAGCGGGGDGGAGGDGGSAGNQGTGNITFAIGKDTSNFIPGKVKEWNAQHSDQQVQLVELPEAADQQRQQFVTTLQAKSDRYDVLGLDVIWTAEFAKSGWIKELSNADFPQANYLPGPYESGVFEGKLWAAPWNTNGGLLFYRKDILDKEGMQPPKTWEEVEQQAKTLGPKYKIGGYAGQFAKYEGLTVNVAEMVWSAGGDIMDSSGKVVVDSPQARTGLGFLEKGFKEGWIPKEAITYKEEEGRRAFQAGKLLFLREWPYAYNLAQEDAAIKGKFDVQPLPGFAGGKPATSIGGYNLAISAYSTKQKTALDFIKWLSNDANQKDRLVKASEMPSLQAIYDDSALQEEIPYLSIMKENLQNSRARPVTPFYNDVSLGIQEDAYAVLQQQKPADQAIADLNSKLQQVVNQ